MKTGLARYSGAMPIRQASVPVPVLFTDPRVDGAALLRAVRGLPRGAWVLFRHYEWPEPARAALFAKVRRAARRRGVRVIVAGILPTRFADCDGWHRGGWRGQMPRRSPPISASVHHIRDLNAAHRAGAAAVFISPVFATNSHKGARPLGVLAYRRIAARARAMGMVPLPLGGMNMARARMMKAKGFGAIDALMRR